MELIDSHILMSIIRNTLNKLDARFIDHGYRVAYMVWKIALYEGTLKAEDIRDLTITSFLHDIGAYKTDDIDKMVEFETDNMMNHSVYGHLFLKYLAPLEKFSRIILCHHFSYEELKKYDLYEWRYIQILSICDRLDVLMTIGNDLEEAKIILKEHRNTLFAPEILDLFFEADTFYQFSKEVYCSEETLAFDILANAKHSDEQLRSYLDMITYSIDFRSQYMVTHTMTTNCISLILGELMGVSQNDMNKIDLGSILHDLGKIGIPIEILDFPGKLNIQQMTIMRKHVEFTAEILDHLLDQDVINIAVRHHEKLNGSGYPLGLDEKSLSFNERIVAIADIISALYEQRSYKGAMPKHDIVRILRSNVENGSLDPIIVEKAILHFDKIMEQVHKECDPMILIYQKMSRLYPEICENTEEYLKNYSDIL